MISKEAIHELIDHVEDDRLVQLHEIVKHFTRANNGDPAQTAANSDPTLFTSKARKRLSAIADHRIATNAETILDNLETELQSIARNDLPPFHVAEGEDGSVAIEWIFPHFRLGFSVEPDEKDSGWFFVSDETMGTINACGYLSEAGIKAGVSMARHHLNT